MSKSVKKNKPVKSSKSAKKNNVITSYFAAADALYQKFKCDEKYPLRGELDCNWQLRHDEGTYFLSLMEDTNKKTDFVVVQKDGKPLVFNADKYSMAIAIDCVKMAFILDANKMID